MTYPEGMLCRRDVHAPCRVMLCRTPTLILVTGKVYHADQLVNRTWPVCDDCAIGLADMIRAERPLGITADGTVYAYDLAELLRTRH